MESCAVWHAGVRQVNRMRGQYLKSVLRQDVGYFDTTATSGEQGVWRSQSRQTAGRRGRGAARPLPCRCRAGLHVTPGVVDRTEERRRPVFVPGPTPAPLP